MDSEFRWYVDPLDGTTNFAHGFPAFCVILGLERRAAGLAKDADGEIIAGVIYDPLRDEMFSAERGKGAFLNGKAIHVSKTGTLAESLTATGFPSHKRHSSPNMHFYQEITLRSHGVRRAGSAGLDLAYVACGRLDGFWEFNLNPWDTSAGILLVEEAGGTVTHFDGGKFTLDSREVFATNGLVKGEMQHLFQEMFAGREMGAIPTPAEFAAKRAAG
jgi:myo-inositol-1(or 4)-monophosphatase